MIITDPFHFALAKMVTGSQFWVLVFAANILAANYLGHTVVHQIFQTPITSSSAHFYNLMCWQRDGLHAV